MKEFEHAVSECTRMQSAQVTAVMDGDDSLFAEDIAAAEERREEAKHALIAHIQDHGC